MGLCMPKHKRDDDDSDHQAAFAGGNVTIINTQESWDQKLEEAKRDGKIMDMKSGRRSRICIFSDKFQPREKIEFPWAAIVDESHLSGQRKKMAVIANFSATWCGPCKMVAPYYRELSEKYLSLMFLVVDVDEMTDFSSNWDIKATPTFFFLQDGEQIDKLVGANKPELQKKITAIADSTACNEK